MKGLLVAGTTSDAGKSVVTAGICRWLARRGVKVAPFKAQNMSLNSTVTRDGAEIGRAQALQAAAARIEPEGAMNPVLLKPGAGGTSQVMLLGEPVAEASARSYPALKPRLAGTVLASLTSLADRFDVVVCEGAGSPAEINLRAHDLANMGLARAAGLPVIVVADIDRGGALAGLFGTLALLSRADQALVAGFVVNKFRGDPAVLDPGLAMLRDLTGRPVLGVLPWTDGLWLDAEDSLALPAVRGEWRRAAGGSPLPGPAGHDVLRVAVVQFPHISNFTDTDPLAAEPGVLVRFVTRPSEIADADLVILPGSRATVADLGWLRDRVLASAITQRAARNGPVLGICGGYQMLAAQIRDDVESGAGLVPGLALLPATVRFGTGKVLRLCFGTADGEQVTGYEIYHGVVHATGGEQFPAAVAPGRCTAPPGTEYSRTTGSAGPCCAGSPPRLAAPSSRLRFLHHVRGRAGTPPGHARRPGRHAPGHRCPARPHLPRRARRPALRPPRSTMSELTQSPPIVLISASDTDLMAARASGGPWRLANPARTAPGAVPELLDGAYCVIVRLLGGRRSWPEGLAAVLAGGLPVVVLSGEPDPDADLMAASTVPAGVAAQALAYLREGGPANLAELARFASDTLLLTGEGFAPPVTLPAHGVHGDRAQLPGRPTVGIVFYRAHAVSGNTAFVDALAGAVEARGGNARAVFCASLRSAGPEFYGLLDGVDALIVTVLAAGGAVAADASAGGDEDAWDVAALAALDVPVLQALCLTASRAAWLDSNAALTPMDAAMQVAVPEFDGAAR